MKPSRLPSRTDFEAVIAPLSKRDREQALAMFDRVYAEAASSVYWQREAQDAKAIARAADRHAAQLEQSVQRVSS